MSIQTNPVQSRHAMSDLLAQYVIGNVSDDSFATFCDLLETAPASSEERLALTGFYLDAVAAGEAEVSLPKPEEMMDVFAIARA